MASTPLDFEKPIIELEKKIEEMRNISDQVDISSEISKLETKINNLRDSIFNNLTPWQIVQLARHPERPYTLDYINLMTKNFIELHGDRQFGDDKALVFRFTIGAFAGLSPSPSTGAGRGTSPRLGGKRIPNRIGGPCGVGDRLARMGRIPLQAGPSFSRWQAGNR